MQVITKEDYKVVIKSWCQEIEDSAMGQLDNLAQLPFTYKHIAVMPDCHAGYGMPIGGVLATEGAVIPNAVGVDIGCGVGAVKLGITADILAPYIHDVVKQIKNTIPVGFKHLESPEPQEQMPTPLSTSLSERFIVRQQYENARYQLGTLGGGNHFIEIQKDSEDSVWIMVHSGSRNLGKQVADYYNTLAVELNKQWWSMIPKEWQLAFLPLGTAEAQDYLFEMNYCVDFAYLNRQKILYKVVRIFRDVLNPTIQVRFTHDVAHNYASRENHFGKNVLVHRKGAVRAREFDMVFIPGSQGTASYYCQGEGNKDSFCSCSHGAGRKMGRKAARQNLNLEKEQALLDSKGIIHSMHKVDDLDEAASAYKDIEDVMFQQEDLVKITEKLTPLAVVKG